MNKKPEFLERLGARSPEGVLRALARYAKKNAAWRDDPIEVRVLLRSGHSVSGTVLAGDQDRDGEYVLLSEGDGLDQALSYLRLADVVSLRLTGTAKIADILKYMEEGGPQTENAPTRLELRRALGELSEGLKKDGLELTLDVDWAALGESPDALTAFSRLGQATARVLRQVAGDSLGRQALQAIKTILLKPGTASPVRAVKSGAQLEVIGQAGALMLGDLDAKLKSVLEAAL